MRFGPTSKELEKTGKAIAKQGVALLAIDGNKEQMKTVHKKISRRLVAGSSMSQC